ncbi:MAG: hypothetical protein PW788_14560 [Micavibrio sp.]|nr:hypothetical protein [Micavibrio sp.]
MNHPYDMQDFLIFTKDKKRPVAIMTIRYFKENPKDSRCYWWIATSSDEWPIMQPAKSAKTSFRNGLKALSKHHEITVINTWCGESLLPRKAQKKILKELGLSKVKAKLNDEKFGPPFK